MNTPNLSRRQFVARAALATAATLATPAASWAKTPDKHHAIRLGAPVFAKTSDPEELALAHRQLGYRAAYCPEVKLDDSTRIKALAEAFAKHDVVIAEVGRWVNLMDADNTKRQENLRTVTEGLALAEAIGARCCVDIAGSKHPTIWFGPHPDNFSSQFFDECVANARQIIDAVKPRRARFCYEMMGWAIPQSPAVYLKLIKAIDRPAFGVHLDPCNAVNSPDLYYRNTDLLNDCFDKLGPWIVSCHAKDLTWDVEMNVHFREVCPGKGVLDYATYLRRLAELKQDACLMIEHLPTAEEYDQARRHILAVGEKSGLQF
jgi:sugar phosphate isomerase/epimerase